MQFIEGLSNWAFFADVPIILGTSTIICFVIVVWRNRRGARIWNLGVAPHYIPPPFEKGGFMRFVNVLLNYY
jgi:hypothetical protein